MLFVDGGNFAMRYGEMLAAWQGIHDNGQPITVNDYGGHTGVPWYEPNVALWAQCLNAHPRGIVRLVRRHYYTSAPGDEPERQRIELWLKDRGFEAPSSSIATRTGVLSKSISP